MGFQTIPFLEIFSALRDWEGWHEDMASWRITQARIQREHRRMTVTLAGAAEAGEWLLHQGEDAVARRYQLSSVQFLCAEERERSGDEGLSQRAVPQVQREVECQPAEKEEKSAHPSPMEQVFARTESFRAEALKQVHSAQPKGKKSGGRKETGAVLYGRRVRHPSIAMDKLQLEMGVAVVEGDVFQVAHQYIKQRKAWIMNLDLTDHRGSIRVNKYFKDGQERGLMDRIVQGMHLKIQGNLHFDRYYGDMVLEPTSIVETEQVLRMDQAPRKRVELHLHTTMSAMDGLTSVNPKLGSNKNIVKRAESWGHSAIAITDHGVAQAFPDAWHSAKDIQILYGVEAYYVNDLDDRVVVHGEDCCPLEGEIVCFDLETTGLDSRRDVIIEIGAVLIRKGEVVEEFQTFVQPNRPLPPKITALTGITEEMLIGAPSQEEALDRFLHFVQDRPLMAHNAPFDMGFLWESCNRQGIALPNTSVDTMVLAQNLLPQLKKHKLNLVAEHLQLEEFQHHRAKDDAITVARIWMAFCQDLRQLDIQRLDQINGKMPQLRRKGGRVKRHPRHLILLAKNQKGLRQLYYLISKAHLDHFKRYPILPKSLIEEHREGLILGSACEAGELFQAILERRNWQELKRIASWYDYLEIQPIANNSFMIRKGMVRDQEELRDLNRTVVKLGEELGKPVCATGDVHFLDPEEEIYRRILLHSKAFEDADEPLPLFFQTTEEMLKEFAYLGEQKAYEVVVEHTNQVAQWCERIEPLPKGLFAPKLDNSEEELLRLVWDQAHALYGETPPALVVERIQTELKDIIDCHYDVIYMSAQKLVQDSLEHGYLVGSRGSVGSSLVAFLSGITEVNSLPAHYRCPQCKHADFDYAAQHGYGCGADMPDALCPNCGTPYEKDGFHIPFETFLGFGGDKIPDIDLNFSGEYQANAHRYTCQLFGADHVFRAGTIGTVAEKTAFGYVKKYLEERNRSVSKTEELRLAMGCTGVKRTTGQHPGGMVVIPQTKEIYDFCPVQHPADDPDTDIVTTHFEYHSMESNLLKLDILGHDDPTMIRMLEDLTGVNARTEIPLDDPDTMSLFSSSKVLGYEGNGVLGATGGVAIPEFGTKFVREMLEDTKPTQFDTLIRLSGFSHGTDVWLGNAKDLITSGTAQVGEAIGCRDDIMIFLISKGIEPKRAFQVMESVRKGRGLPEGAEEEMIGHQIPVWYIESCKKISYLFPKAHAVAYVMMAFRIAWFKVHRPLAFYAAYFSIRAKAFDQKYMCEGLDVCLQKMQQLLGKEKSITAVEKDMLTTLEVCYEFYLRGFSFQRLDLYQSDATRFQIAPGGQQLIPPFVSVVGLGETAAISLVEQRVGREFISIEEVGAACPKLSKTHLELLKNAGAFGNLPESGQMNLFSLLS